MPVTSLRALARAQRASLFALAIAIGVAAAGCGSGSATTPSPTTLGPATSLKLYYQDNAQVALVGSNGRRIFIDAYAPDVLPAPKAGPNDILLTTHTHEDHYVAWFHDEFPGQQLFATSGSIKLPDVTITSLTSSHDGDPNGSDYIFVIDFAGLRIVHFGDCGQKELTAEQLAAIEPGKVDVAVSQLSNDLSSMNAQNHKGLDLMRQAKPLIFIPTHHDDATVKQAYEAFGGVYSDKPITLSRAMLPAKTTMLVMGGDADWYKRQLNLAPAGW